jgi:hypothetical protein
MLQGLTPCNYTGVFHGGFDNKRTRVLFGDSAFGGDRSVTPDILALETEGESPRRPSISGWEVAVYGSRSRND